MASPQLALEFPTEPPPRRRPRYRALRVAESPLTLELATEQARRALSTAGLGHQVSRVVAWPTTDRPHHLTVVALLRTGADPDKVAEALAELSSEVKRGAAMVAVYRKRES